ncbi:hypothetical protein [Effusibacillus dendaii]|uniref:Uncharacterized protein n=1 Tax=Effusibacillus dendaii TaxID=2743772 RepID=A0A7I8DEK9_9BACL|nr:hypothetical protein [Effusibacillus dendaii]BCJ86351.1 hypothetical protein skT53_13360 [Effusibacillus dendaii]
MKPIHKLLSLSIPQKITLLCLLGLRANGLIQMGLQNRIVVNAGQLKTQVTEAQQLFSGMKDGLGGLTELKAVTVHMSGNVQELQSATADMDQGLQTLNQTVSGINQSVAGDRSVRLTKRPEGRSTDRNQPLDRRIDCPVDTIECEIVPASTTALAKLHRPTGGKLFATLTRASPYTQKTCGE